ncbi:MAG TPA: sensor histidine kinase [Caulobacteraceae bacterium]|nr:sensor histidine kinase [Caulobacteraceae bacterium]
MKQPVSHVGMGPIILLTAGLWSSVWVFFTLRSVFLAPNFWEQASARFLANIVGAALSFGIYLLLRTQARRRFVVVLALAFGASVLAAMAYAVVAGFLYSTIAPAYIVSGESVSFFEVLIERTQAVPWVFFAWCCGFLALDYAERLRANELRLIELQSLAADAQNRMLRYQIQPHFLFNTLSAISTLVRDREAERAERMVLSLSRFLRSSLVRSPEEMVPLCEEVEIQDLYLGIEQERFGDRLKLVKDIEKGAEHCLVPSLILQPLVENAVKYAVAESTKPVTITISAVRNNRQVALTVKDDGPGMRAAPPSPAGGLGVGLENVRRRLEVAYGERAAFRHGPEPGGGYRVGMVIPAMEGR